mgnify:CR=1 FL=1
MAGWYNKVSNDMAHIPDAMDYFETELGDARLHDLQLRGKPLERISAELPGVVELRYNQLQEIEAILEFLNIELRKKRSEKFRHFIEHYQRALSSRDAEKFVDGEESVINLQHLCNQYSLLRNKYLGIMKGLDTKQWQIGHIVKLRTAGMEDISL